MNEVLTQNRVVTIVFIVMAVVVALFFVVKAMQIIGMEKIRACVYRLFIHAEHSFKHGDNKEKFEFVVGLARDVIPSPFNLFITEKFLRETIQLWFDLVKDLLDDGKLNKTNKKDTEV